MQLKSLLNNNYTIHAKNRELGELIGIATSNKSGLMSPKLYCAIPNSYVVNSATELKGKYVKIISVNDWSGSIINVKVSNMAEILPK